MLAAAAALALPAASPARSPSWATRRRRPRSLSRNCQAVSRTTGYQAKVGPDRALYKAPADGRIVAWTIALGKPGPKQTAFFTERLGGESQAAVVVLAPGSSCAASSPRLRCRAHGLLRPGRPVPARAVAADQEGPVRRPDGAHVGARAADRPGRRHLLARDPRQGHLRRHRDPVRAARRRRRDAFPCLFRTARLTYSATIVTNPAPRSRPAERRGGDGDPPAAPRPCRRSAGAGVLRAEVLELAAAGLRAAGGGLAGRGAWPPVGGEAGARGRRRGRGGVTAGGRRGGRRRGRGGGRRRASPWRRPAPRSCPSGSSGRARSSGPAWRARRRSRTRSARRRARGRRAGRGRWRRIRTSGQVTGSMRRPQCGQSLRSRWASWSHQVQNRRFSTAQGRRDRDGGSGSTLATISSVSPVSLST